jgi:hypothetical protein
MKKIRADSVLDALPENQRAQLEAWLFEESLSYKDAAARLLADFNVRSAPSSLSAWYQHTAQRRMLDRIAASSAKANQVMDKLKANPADTYAALMGVIGQAAFEQSLDNPTLNVETLTHLANLALSGRSLELKEKDLSLKRDRFEFDAAKACLAKLPALRAIAGNSSLDQKAKITQIRLALFGAAPE